MSEEPENWQIQARADLFVVWDALDELRSIEARIGNALREGDYELYRQAISDFTGLEERK